MSCILKSKIPALTISGVFTATVGVVMYCLFPLIMDSEIKKRLVLKEGTEGFKNWKDIPVPIYLHFYFFNLTNTEDVYKLKSKPILQQLGPYTYREIREKVIISRNKNSTITYRQVSRWFYQPDRTNGSLDDVITTLNVPMVAAAMKAKQMDKFAVYFALQEVFEHFECTWFVQKKVRELLFEGYEDPLMKLAEIFTHEKFDRFGWFYKRNGTDSGEYNIFTGLNDIENLDSIDTWNGQRKLPAFHSYCSMINGSAGDLWSPHLTTSSKATMFVPEICRSMSFSYSKDVSIHGVRTYRYGADETQFDNGKYNPDNKCFCDGDICLPPGVVNISSCKFDAPSVVSYPHFLYADSMYGDGVIGLDPDPEKHRMFFDIIPEMGIPLRVAARMQINIVFEAIPRLRQFQNITQRIYFPVLWFSEDAVSDEKVSSQFIFILTTIPLIAQIFSLIAIVVGVILTFVALYLALRKRWEKGELPYSAVVSS